MAKSISFDTGVEEYEVNGGQAMLRFNPTDPGLFARILDLQGVIAGFEQRYADLEGKVTGEQDEHGFPIGADTVAQAMRQMDIELKEELRTVFGQGNDFDAIFGHMSALAITDTGNSIVGNFLEAVVPLIEGNMDEREKIVAKVQQAKQKAAQNRAQRRASGHGGKR
ncbi:hypothetical protein LJC60_09475 [Ruminococcaceae bacterium OttesenSCG-928-D13]|nr:hypothetical protein [Ruminococcaceae bacterium OttesenSCG-928-D13]